ncbi:MAG: radical SAM family heme chaperone HemW [Lewinella sp.]|nr:radical SAM family heme chaperone HemW [Lewinella sp.]
MAGLYLHIPFCRQACHYCNFHFSTSLQYRAEMVAAIIREISWRQGYLAERELQSVYFGGGTPSLLSPAELGQIFAAIGAHFRLVPGAEVTLEANPDDLTADYLAGLRDTPVNRLSIGIQSFSDTDLRFMHRAHDAHEAQASLERALAAGFEQLTIDLIYGAPTTTDEQWLANIDRALALGIPHLSCYALTVEPRTALAHQIKTGQAPPMDEQQAARQFAILVEQLEGAGFLHYEISNFARPTALAVHNSNYWRGVPYLGVGPAAHSYDGDSRQWNVANNAKYLRRLAEIDPVCPPQIDEEPLFEREVLSPTDRYNEYVMTGLRTMWGVQPEALTPEHQAHFLTHIQQFIDKKLIVKQENSFILTRSGRFLADGIAADLFI